MSVEIKRCRWATNDLLIAYHDEEYGRLSTDDRDIFEKICLESFSGGLSFYIALKKRPALREAFGNFDIDHCANMSDADLEAALQMDIIRNRRKVEAVRSNARVCQSIIADEGSLIAFIQKHPLHQDLTLALKERGIRQFGPVSSVELLKSLGFIRAHEADCSFSEDWKPCQPS